MQKEHEYLIQLLKCAIRDEKPDEKPDDASWEEIFTLAKFHSVAGTIYYSVKKLQNPPPPELLKKITDIRSKAVAKDMMQRAEYRAILSAFEKAKIRCLPIKGFFVKNFYPKPDMRMMGDLDILIDPKNAKKAQEAMLSLGYACESFGKHHHDVYHKRPVMHVELHRELIAEKTKSMRACFGDGFSKAVVMSGFQYAFEMTDEDAYVYCLAHFYKHHIEGGSGIRSVMDIYMLNEGLKNRLDKKSVEEKLKKIGLSDFSEKVCALAEAWFGESELSEELNELGGYIITSGTYGTTEHTVTNQLSKKGKAGYFFYNMFLPYGEMKGGYPILKKLPFLLPFFWAVRLVSSIFGKREKVSFKLKAMFEKK